MSPTQGQAVIIGAIPYQPFRNTQGRFCMAGYHCLMLNSIICANHPYLIHLAPFCWQSFVRCLWHHFFAIGHPNIIPFCNVLLLLGITNARARYTRICWALQMPVLDTPGFQIRHNWDLSNNIRILTPKNRGCWSRKGHSVEKTAIFDVFRKVLIDKWLRRYLSVNGRFTKYKFAKGKVSQRQRLRFVV